jgi:serine/threonine protein kinase
MAPERAMGQRDRIDARSDLWAIGAMMFKLLSGQPVHDETSPTTLLARHASKAVRPLRSVDASIAPAVAEVVDRALAFDIDTRWPDAATMKRALEGAASSAFGDTLIVGPRLLPMEASVPGPVVPRLEPTERIVPVEVDRSAPTETMAPSTPPHDVPRHLRALGAYRVTRRIGNGGMATVYEAVNTKLEKRVALKVLHSHVDCGPDARARFLREGRAAARLHHPHVVDVFEFGEHDGQYPFRGRVEGVRRAVRVGCA